ncbi:hypothetical protein AOQ84DRAFT_339368 [Glonium stellatum]|uniref:Zn(2)-C6 fungal-type domain-containing protein n=1 Tax=Glonium stellatum TaxID=574774 RepID=A0A8E2F2L4_9PEZI|nr:hypothetical protein AOQ84DRAFT_339368 [Glonium stellatum]
MQSNEPSPPDFKYAPSLSLGQTLKRDRSSPERAQSPVKFISDPHNYPRKRASIACEICRVRKTRCDGAKPSCVSCVKLGVACSYAKLASGNRPEQDAAGLFLSKIDSRLDRIDARLDQIESILDTKDCVRHDLHQTASPRGPSTRTTASTPNSRTAGSTPDNRSGTVSFPSPFSPRLPGAPQASASPFLGYSQVGLSLEFLVHLEGHEIPRNLRPLQFNETEDYLAREVAQGSRIFQPLDSGPSHIDTSPQARLRLQRSFANTTLAWFPIFDQEAFSKWAAESYNHNFDQQDQHSLDTALTLFILALGALPQDECVTSDDPRQFSSFPYFLAACKVFNQDPVSTCSIIEIQCHLLKSLYLLLCLRPFQASQSIAQASRSIITLLNFRSRLESDVQLQEACHRAYWVCFIIEYELFAHIAYSSPLISPKVHEIVSLPISHSNEPGMYWFLTEISLRRLYIYALECVWKETGTQYEPIVIEVLHQQVCTWYDGLHPSVKFPEDTLPLLDPQKAFLRSQYFSLRWIICWPSIMRILTKEPDDEKQHAELLRFSSETIHYMIQHVLSAETLVQQRHQMLFANLLGWVFFFLLPRRSIYNTFLHPHLTTHFLHSSRPHIQLPHLRP